MNVDDIKMGKMLESWEGTRAQTITLGVTEACDLRCRYCYMTGKNSNSRMSFETAKKAVNFVLSEESGYFKDKESVIWDFIGGEPFLEIDLIDKICDYIKIETYKRGHKWFDSYRFSFSTNGLTYDTPAVQKYIEKNKRHVSIGISVDGNKIKHDAQRVYADGSGSFDNVARVVPLWTKQFPDAMTKATFAHDDLIHIKDSVIALWNMGIKTVAANVVFEDVWEEGDDEIYEDQLIQLADYILENKLWNECSVRFFDPNSGFPMLKEDLDKNYCGSGNMISIDYKGDIYPCIRFTSFTLNNSEGYKIGDIYTGINENLVRPFKNLITVNQSEDACIECEVGSSCPWCTGFNYDDVNGETLFHRAIYLCKMWKANMKVNEYFWKSLSEKLSIENPRDNIRKSRKQLAESEENKFILIMTHDNIEPHCSYTNNRDIDTQMTEGTFDSVIEFCKDNNYIPVVLGSNVRDDSYMNIGGTGEDTSISVHNNRAKNKITENNIVLVDKENIINLNTIVADILKSDNVNRLNIIITDLESWNEYDIEIYKKQLESMADTIYDMYIRNRRIEINVLTDIFDKNEIKGCGSGTDTFTVAPNGKFYICPAFYYNDENDFIGDLERGINIKRPDMLSAKSSYICSNCDSFHCRRCLYLNKKMTKEINTPSHIQCLVSHIERNISRNLEIKLIKADLLDPVNFINKIDYVDPIEKIKEEKGW
ncbi:radical SAM peptide maturase, CXXX-repeat target family [Sedimentibacter sp.]|uniref:radical SAM peptide maturase, CXXX-repeat target family n=1 Tax=Sedimentibacter sp. TaxID=1960295 RepID=UPI0028967ABB|nr:radical SAM peptide maturase, CXXX-repeat target family [Sedimentibacter sp.]